MKSVYQDIDKYPENHNTGQTSDIIMIIPDDPANDKAVEYMRINYKEVYNQYTFKKGSLNRKTAYKNMVEYGIKFRYSGDQYIVIQDLGIWIKDNIEYNIIEVKDIKTNKLGLCKANTLYHNSFNIIGMIDNEFNHYN